MAYTNRDEEYQFKFAIPRSLLWCGVALLGFALGVGATGLVVKADEANAYKQGHAAGYDEGRATCVNPSRAHNAASWLFGPKG